jgi:hypothetical protein
MAKQKLPPATDWKERNIENWTTTTFKAYLVHLSEETFHLPYVPFKGGWAAEMKLLKLSIEEMGTQVLKELIEEAYKGYKPSANYPSLSFGFIYSYMKPQLYPRILKRKQEEEETRKREENKIIKSKEELKKFF